MRSSPGRLSVRGCARGSCWKSTAAVSAGRLGWIAGSGVTAAAYSPLTVTIGRGSGAAPNLCNTQNEPITQTKERQTMTDPRIEKLADVLVNYSVAVRPGDKVFVNGSTLAEPLLKAVYAKVLQAGGYPLMQVSLPGTDELLFRYGSDEQLQYVPEPVKLIVETYDVRITIMGAENTKALSNVDPARMVLRDQAHTELMKIFMRRSASGELRWVGTLFPTNAYAQDAEMSLSEYEDFVYGACLPDMDDPVGYWQRFSARQQKIVDWLKGKERVRVIGPETDLHLSIAGRVFINCDGH
nr:hypothetical protein [Anaerolineae bacterium]